MKKSNKNTEIIYSYMKIGKGKYIEIQSSAPALISIVGEKEYWEE